MFDIGFGELLLVGVIGLIVLGPQRLPVAVRTVAGWIRAMRSLASSVQHELAQELKLQELQESLRKVEQASKAHYPPELKASVEELRQATAALQKDYSGEYEKSDDESYARHYAAEKSEAEPQGIQSLSRSKNQQNSDSSDHDGGALTADVINTPQVISNCNLADDRKIPTVNPASSVTISDKP